MVKIPKLFKIRKKGGVSYFAVSLFTVFVTLFLSFIHNRAVSTVFEAHASLGVLKPLMATQVSTLNFGSILPALNGGNVVISKTSGQLACPNKSQCSQNFSRGKFDVTGSDGELTVSHTDGVLSDGTGRTMAVDIDITTPVTIVNGTASFYIGGTMEMGRLQKVGIYNTSKSDGVPYTVTINY